MAICAVPTDSYVQDSLHNHVLPQDDNNSEATIFPQLLVEYVKELK